MKFYRFCRYVSIAIMAVAVTTIVVTTFMASPSFAAGSPNLAKICSNNGVRFCLVMPAADAHTVSIVYHSTKAMEGFA